MKYYNLILQEIIILYKDANSYKTVRLLENSNTEAPPMTPPLNLL